MDVNGFVDVMRGGANEIRSPGRRSGAGRPIGWRSTLRSVDLGAVEQALCSIPDVRSARLVANGSGDLIEVNIVATPGKTPKQLVRDVQSMAIAFSGVDIDDRIVNVTHHDEAADVTPPPEQTADPAPKETAKGATNGQPVDRVIVDSVLVAKQDLRATATVTLRRGAEKVIGTAEGTVASTARWRIVAEASLHALRRLEPGAESVAVEMAGVQRIGDRELGIVTLVMVIPPNEELLAGVAPVRSGSEEDAVARAVLDATNRRLARLR
jgi:hypothetical protein